LTALWSERRQLQQCELSLANFPQSTPSALFEYKNVTSLLERRAPWRTVIYCDCSYYEEFPMFNAKCIFGNKVHCTVHRTQYHQLKRIELVKP
jgi:hypothetical protein